MHNQLVHFNFSRQALSLIIVESGCVDDFDSHLFASGLVYSCQDDGKRSSEDGKGKAVWSGNLRATVAEVTIDLVRSHLGDDWDASCFVQHFKSPVNGTCFFEAPWTPFLYFKRSSNNILPDQCTPKSF